MPESTLWPADPHTFVKHALLERYTGAWFSILSTEHHHPVYIDGFAGPGEYEGGKLGSPIVVLEAAIKNERLSNKAPQFLFVEEREDRARHLREVLKKYQIPPSFEVEVEEDEFEVVLGRELDEVEQKGAANNPVFAFVDPFGYSGIPYELFRRLLNLRRTEIFVLFARREINRWVTSGEEPKLDQIHRLFGLNEIEIDPNQDRHKQLKDLYEAQVSKIAKFVCSFTMKDSNNNLIYDLFFLTNNLKGFKEMKRAMWWVDDSGAFAFSDAHQNQLFLLRDEPVERLAQMIKERGQGRSKVAVGKITKYVEEETLYVRPHMTKALGLLRDQGLISVESLKTDGRPYHSQFPDTTVINFTVS